MNRSYCQFTSFLEREGGAHEHLLWGRNPGFSISQMGKLSPGRPRDLLAAAPGIGRTELECGSPRRSGAFPVSSTACGHPPPRLFSHDKPCSLLQRGNERCLTRRLLSCHGNFPKSQRGPGLCGPSSLPVSGASPGCAPRSLGAGLEPGGRGGDPEDLLGPHLANAIFSLSRLFFQSPSESE